jgi:hypothetical protein
MKTMRFSCGRILLLTLFIGSYFPVAGCSSSSSSSDSKSTTEYTLPDDVKAEIKARKEKAKAERKIKARNIKTH